MSGKQVLIMAVVKLTKKQQLDELAARLTIDLKKKVTLQDLLDLCVEIASEEYDRLLAAFLGDEERLTPEKVAAIRAMATSFEEHTTGSVDGDLY